MATSPASSGPHPQLLWTGNAPILFPVPPPPPLPVMLATALALELELDTHTIDLGKVTGIFLRDPFATLELFRRAHEECGERFERVEDCLVSLPVSCWPGRGSAPVPPEGDGHAARALAAFANHARLVAERCRALVTTGEVPGTEEMDLEQSYLAGLLHEAAEVSELLNYLSRGGWASPSFPRRISHSLPASWYVPASLRAFLAHGEAAEPCARLVEAAHLSLLEEILVPA